MVSASNSGRPEGARGRPPKERPASAFSASTPRIKKCGPQRPHKKCRGDPVRPRGPRYNVTCNGTGEFFTRKSHAKWPFSGRERDSPVAPKGDRRVFLGEVLGGIAILRFSGHPF